MRTSASISLLFFSALLAVACSPGSSASSVAAGDASAASDSPATVPAAEDAGDGADPRSVYPAPHPGAPQVVNAGGPVLATPRFVPVLFAGDPDADRIEALVATLGSTSYWKAVTAEYGVGPAVSAEPIVIANPPAAALTDTAIRAWLATQLDGTHAAWGTPDPNAVYVLFYPATTTITTDAGAVSCSTVHGYHYEATFRGASVAYAVIPRCSSDLFLSGFDVLSAATSHELVEAVTNPRVFSNPAFGAIDEDHYGWTLFAGGSEVADLCGYNTGGYAAPPELGGARVTRSWSNKAAAAGLDPCVPTPADLVYYNSIPVLNEAVTVRDASFGAIKSQGVAVPVGESKDVELDLFSNAATSGPWTVKAVDLPSLNHQSPELKFSFDRSTGINGDKLHLKVTRARIGAHGGTLFMVVSTLGSTENLWWGFAGN